MKFLFYILLSLFSLSSFSETQILTFKCDTEVTEALNKYLGEDGLLSKECREAEEETDACCVNPSRCPKHIAKKVGQSLLEIGSQFTQQFLQVKGAVSGNQYDNCSYQNISKVVGTLDDSFKVIMQDSCYDSIDQCEETCGDRYKEFLTKFINKFTENSTGNKTVLLSEKDLQDFKDGKLDIEGLKGIAKNITDECEGDAEFETFNDKYQDGTLNKKTKFTKSKGIEDFVTCDKIIDALTPEQLEKPMRELQLEMCRKALKAHVGRARRPTSVNNPNLLNPGTTLAGNEDPNGPGSNAGNTGVDTSQLDDDFGPSNGKAAFPNGFAKLAGGSGDASAGPGGAGAPSPSNGNSEQGFNGYDDEGFPYEAWSERSNGGSRGKASTSLGSQYGSGDSSNGDKSPRNVAANTVPLDLNKYINSRKEKSIFQMASQRIQKYCSEKIKHKCL